MPFTASLGKGRESSGLSPCGPLLKKNQWNEKPWEKRIKEYCSSCSFRFLKQPTCSLDFLSFGDIQSFKWQLSTVLFWVAQMNPGWDSFSGGNHEARAAYHGKKMPTPKMIIQDFVTDCLEDLDTKSVNHFFKVWNQIVEGYNGKPFKIDDEDETMLETANRIVGSWMNPKIYSDDKLRLFYAAMSILEDAANTLEIFQLEDACGRLVEACRKAIHAGAELKIA